MGLKRCVIRCHCPLFTSGFAYGPILLTLGVVIVSTALRRPARPVLIAMAILLGAATLVIGLGVWTGTRVAAEFVSMTAWLILPAAVGVTIKARRDASTAVRGEQGRDDAHERRLAGAVAPEQREHGAALHAHVDAGERGHGAEGLVEALGDDHRDIGHGG